MSGSSLVRLLRGGSLLLGALLAAGSVFLACGAEPRQVECVEGAESCGPLAYCRADHVCAIGCESDKECAESHPATPYCVKESHLCVACRTGANCPEGQICDVAGSCSQGCDESQNKFCPEGQICCNLLCADPTSSELHCGACGQACGNGAECCASLCVDTLLYLDDENNCGACGNRCLPGLNASIFSCNLGKCVYECEPGYADCDPEIPGCESKLTDTTSCGGCGHVCNTVGSDMRCVADESDPNKSRCVYTGCIPGYGDCDQGINPDNGCETDLTSPENCGECGAKCSKIHGQPQCQSGLCVYASCEADWGDCRGAGPDNPHNLDGCESNLNDIATCGTCKTACSSPHGDAHCTNKQCVYECEPGWEDCQKDGENSVGCETSLLDASNCGGCGVKCGNTGADASTCVADKGSFVCQYTCKPGYADCTSAPGCETNLNTDTSNCGGCGVVCDANLTQSASAQCVGGQCKYSDCKPGFADCSQEGSNPKGCETPTTSPLDCGGCGKTCMDVDNAHASSPPECVAGSCTYAAGCQKGFADCNKEKLPLNADGCETPTNTTSDCGGCGNVCDTLHSTPSGCTGQKCLYELCQGAWQNCDDAAPDTNGCETNTLNDPKNCGGCGVVCDPKNSPDGTVSCKEGKCLYGGCKDGLADCDTTPPNSNGCETNPQTSVAHCGQCNNPCSPKDQAHAKGEPVCEVGQCVYKAGCETGWANCKGTEGGNADGCETPTNTTSDCGGCGNVCDTLHSTPSGCTNQKCAYEPCEAGWQNCDDAAPDTNGCETNTLNDPKNCGGCGVVCDPTNTLSDAATCVAGKCQYSACKPGFDDCDKSGSNANGCETDLTQDEAHCGQCGNTCASQLEAHAISAPVCKGGVCTYAACAAGWDNCNGGFDGNADGCETSLNLPTSCGGCGDVCDTLHSTPSGCTNQKCTYGTCETGWQNCDKTGPDTNGCETNTLNDPKNCGGCGVVCDPTNTLSGTATCSGGKCVYNSACKPGFTDCDKSGPNAVACETATASDTANCGACGNTCSDATKANATDDPVCASGVCAYTCQSGFTSCTSTKGNADGCEASLTSTSSCGGCGVVCSGAHALGSSCNGTRCSYGCASGWYDCNSTVGANTDGCERPMGPDACGGCTQVCASNATVQSRACTGSKCSYTCSTGYANCNAAAAGIDPDGCECKTPTKPALSPWPGGCCPSGGCMRSMKTGLTPAQVATFPAPTTLADPSWYPSSEPVSTAYLTCETSLTAKRAAQLSCLAATKPGVYAPPYDNQSAVTNNFCKDPDLIRYLQHPDNPDPTKKVGGFCSASAPFNQKTSPCVCWFFVYAGLSNAVGKVSVGDEKSGYGCRGPRETDPSFDYDTP